MLSTLPPRIESAVRAADSLTGRANTIVINRAFREEYFYRNALRPVCGRFDAVERAIRRTRKFFSDTGEPCEGLAYALALDVELSRIVNSAW